MWFIRLRAHGLWKADELSSAPTLVVGGACGSGKRLFVADFVASDGASLAPRLASSCAPAVPYNNIAARHLRRGCRPCGVRYMTTDANQLGLRRASIPSNEYSSSSRAIPTSVACKLKLVIPRRTRVFMLTYCQNLVRNVAVYSQCS